MECVIDEFWLKMYARVSPTTTHSGSKETSCQDWSFGGDT
jgi:hypothetical protein